MSNEIKYGTVSCPDCGGGRVRTNGDPCPCRGGVVPVFPGLDAAPAEVRVDVEAAVEAVHSALLNLDNLAKMNPSLRAHPFFIIVRMQLVEGVKLLGRDPEE